MLMKTWERDKKRKFSLTAAPFSRPDDRVGVKDARPKAKLFLRGGGSSQIVDDVRVCSVDYG